MKESDLKPAGSFAAINGAKMVAFGPPGVGKTPLINTAPRPVLMACEPGLLSMQGSNVPTWCADSWSRIDEFMKWVFGSAEAANYDTICIDSISEMAEIVLRESQKRNKDGRAAYGDMSRNVVNWLWSLYGMPRKHMYLIAKMGLSDEEGMNVKIPLFPGKDLPAKVTHLFDIVAYIDKARIPNIAQPQLAIRTKGNFAARVRDRSGRLDELEQPNLTNIFNKVMGV